MKVPLFILVLLAAIVLLTGNSDYEDAVAEQNHYCEMVQTGHWPDYKNIYEEVCK